MGPFDDEDDDLFDDDLGGNFPASDDIFRKGKIDEEIDPDFIGRDKLSDDVDRWKDKDLDEDDLDDELDSAGGDFDDDELDD